MPDEATVVGDWECTSQNNGMLSIAFHTAKFPRSQQYGAYSINIA
jgi:hypothetical protein